MTNFINKLRDSEGIVLWVGDLLGKLMGYPSKRDLANLIYNDLNENIKLAVTDKYSLSEVTQCYLDSVTGSKMKLLNKLKNSFLNSRETSDLFFLFPKSPLIKTIITTNFDNLIERAYEDQVQKIENFEEIQKLDTRPKLYKINSDFEHLDRMIVTKQDFRKLKILNLYDQLFESIKKEIEGKVMIFIGYDLEDPDLKETLSFLYDRLGGPRPDSYFVTSSSIIDTETIDWLNSNEIKLLKQNELEFLEEFRNYLVEEGEIQDTSNNSLEEELVPEKKFQ